MTKYNIATVSCSVIGGARIKSGNEHTELNILTDSLKDLEGVLLSGYINAPHTSVSGSDGKFGYGGSCFPKDVNAFVGCLKDTQIFELMSQVPLASKSYREQKVLEKV